MGVLVAVRDAVARFVGEGVRVKRSVGVGVSVGWGAVGVSERCKEGVRVNDRVAVGVPLARGLRVGVAVRVGRGERVGDSRGGVKPNVAVDVGRPVRVVVGVRTVVGVRENVGEEVGVRGSGGVRVGVKVGVGVGGLPTETSILAGAPRFPARSRSCTVTIVSPCGNPFTALIERQNCTSRGSPEINRGAPKGSTVHALPRVSLTLKPQLRALTVATISGRSSKLAGDSPGTPPSGQSPRIPLPRGRDTSTCRSGRAEVSSGNPAPTSRPTAVSLLPGAASTTRMNPEPPPL